MKLTDEEILALYYERSENAICETDRKYGKLCRKISNGIILDKRDREEIINDTWLALWDAIPPGKPDSFKAYVCRVVKNLALKKYEYNHAMKRRSEYEISLEELADCVSGGGNVEESMLQKELVDVINQFLKSISRENRMIFLRRYWFMHSVKDIARDNHISEKSASMRLTRIRQQLKMYLHKEGYGL